MPALALPPLLLLLLLAAGGQCGTASLQDRLEQCKRHCPARCERCDLRYVFAQYHLELDCSFSVAGAAIGQLIDCPYMSDLHVLIVTRVNNIDQLLPRLSQLTKLKHLNLSNNLLTALPPNTFASLKNLKDLILDDNRLENLTDHSLAVTSLQSVSLRHNRIQRVSSKAFDSRLDHLNVVDLRGNRLTTLTSWPLLIRRQQAEEKLWVYLDNNRIENFEDTGGSDEDERRRQETRVRWTKRQVADTNLVLSLAHNRVRHLTHLVRGWNIDDSTMRELGTRRAITINTLYGNPLACDCVDYEMYASANNISLFLPNSKALPYCESPPRLKYHSVYNAAFRLEIDKRELVCREKCNAGKCTCTREPWRQTVSVDCIGEKLDRLPHRRELATLPDGYAFRFNFSASRLKSGLPGMPSVYRDARTLDLSGTGLEQLPMKYLNKLRRIEELNVNNNLFKTLDRRIADLPFPHLRSLRLDKNMWSCDCNNSWMAAWLRKMRPQLRLQDQVRCTSPPWLFDRELLGVRESEFCQRPDPVSSNRSYDRIALSSSAISAALAVLAAAFFLVSCSRVSLFTRFGFHPFDRDECDGELKRCDAFVLFHPNDSDWVVSVLVEKLTNRRNPYVLCTHDRACIPGLLTYSAVCHAVENSKRVIAVVTENFISDVDVCTDYQLTVTFLTRTQPRQSNRLIHILFPGVHHLPHNLVRPSLSVKTVIRYGKKNFWKQVLYRMPLSTVNQLSVSKTVSGNTHDCSSSFHTLNEDQRNSLLQKTCQDYCISYSNVYEPSAERNQATAAGAQVRQTNSASSINSLNVHPLQASILTFPRASRVSTFRSPEEALYATDCNEATL